MKTLNILIMLAFSCLSFQVHAADRASFNKCGTYSVADDFFPNGSVRIVTGDFLVNIGDLEIVGSLGMESDVAEKFSTINNKDCVCLGGTIQAWEGVGVITDLDYLAPVADASSVPVCKENNAFSQFD